MSDHPVGQRWRLVTLQGTEEHVSSVPLGREEAYEHLAYEAALHTAAGWNVTWVTKDEVFATRNNIERTITVRSYEAMEDV